MLWQNQKKINWEILSLTRFLLAMIVTVGHLVGHSDIGFLKWYSYLGSFEAILGFLLISGFSIGTSIQKHKKNYFKRRLQRIYPVYIVSIIFQCIVSGAYLNSNTASIIVLNLFFLNHIFISYSFVGQAWTLSTEVWLYCLAPLLLKLKDKWLTIIIYSSFCSYIIYTCGRTLFHWSYYSTTNYGINLILLAFIWVAGFKLAVSNKKSKDSLTIFLLFAVHILISVGIQVLFRLKHKEQYQIIDTDLVSFVANTVCLAFVYIVVVYNNYFPDFSNTISKIFNFLGNISYPLYLTHLTTFLLLQKRGESNAAVLLGSALIVSILVYWVFDFYSKKRVLSHKYATA